MVEKREKTTKGANSRNQREARTKLDSTEGANVSEPIEQRETGEENG